MFLKIKVSSQNIILSRIQHGFSLQTVNEFYKDGERVKTNKGGVALLQTFLVLEIKAKYASLQAELNCIEKPNKNENLII